MNGYRHLRPELLSGEHRQSISDRRFGSRAGRRANERFFRRWQRRLARREVRRRVTERRRALWPLATVRSELREIRRQAVRRQRYLDK